MMIDPINSKNVALIKDANGKDIERIYDRSGNLVFKNWNTLEGPLPIGCFTSSNKLRNYRIYGNTIQDGTPAPETPVEVQGCGVRTENLFDKSAKNTNNGYIPNGYLESDGSEHTNIYYLVSEYIAVSPNQSYTLLYGSNLNTPSVCFYDNSKNFISGVAYSGKQTVPFTTPQNTAFLRLSCLRSKAVSEVMLNFGSTALPYEPYGYKIPVTVSGVNLFDYNWLWTKENVKLNDYFNCITIAMKPNTEYTISNNYRVLKSPKLVETALIVVNSETEITTVNGGVDRIRTVTTASDGLLRIAYRTTIADQYYQDIVVNRDTLADGTYYIQINEGSSASPYEPYHEPITTPVYIGSEPLHKIGDYADYVDFKRGVVVRQIKKSVLTGNEAWIENVHNANQDVYRINNFANYKQVSGNVGLHKCSHILYMYPYSSDLFDRLVLVYFASMGHVLFFSTRKSLGIDNLDKFKAFLSTQYEAGTPVTVWYVLDTPEEEEVLPLSQKIPTNIGSNTFSCTISPAPSKAMIQYKKK